MSLRFSPSFFLSVPCLNTVFFFFCLPFPDLLFSSFLVLIFFCSHCRSTILLLLLLFKRIFRSSFFFSLLYFFFFFGSRLISSPLPLCVCLCGCGSALPGQRLFIPFPCFFFPHIFSVFSFPSYSAPWCSQTRERESESCLFTLSLFLSIYNPRKHFLSRF